MDLRQRIVDLAQVRALVVPIGSVSQAEFEDVMQFFLETAKIPLGGLNLSALAVPQFLSRGSLAEGVLSFNFASSYLRDHADWEEFQINRQLLCIIGVAIQRGDQHSVIADYRHFLAVASKFVAVLQARFVVFQASPGLPSVEDANIHVVSLYDRSLGVFCLKDLLGEMASLLVKQMVSMVDQFEKRSYIVSPLPSERGQGADELARLKKRCAGRVRKLVADVCLILGSIQDALNQYGMAIELLRQNTDSVWLAGALEGFCCAYLLKPGRIEIEKPTAENQDISERFQEIMSLYSKAGAHLLFLEAVFKLGRFHVENGRHIDASDTLMQTLSVLSEFTIFEQIQVCTSLAAMYLQMRFHRKVGFFLFRAALIYRQQSYWSLARELLSKTLFVYKLYDAPFVEYHSKSELTGWPAIQRVVLQELVDVSSDLDDKANAFYYTLLMLKRKYYFLDAKDQELLSGRLWILAEKASFSFPHMSFRGIPLLRRLEVVPGPMPPALERIGSPLSADDSSRIFNPFEDRGRTLAPMRWIANESLKFIAEFSNPLGCSLVLQRVSVCVEEGIFDASETSLVLPPYCPSMKLVLFGRPLSPTPKMILRGLHITTFNLQSLHLVDASGFGVDDAALYPSLNTPSAWEVEAIGPLARIAVMSPRLFESILSLYEGQTIELTLRIENIGGLPIDSLAIEFVESLTGGEDVAQHPRVDLTCVLEVDPTRRLPLPLPPHSAIDVPLIVRGRYGCAGGELRIKFGSFPSTDGGPFFTRTWTAQVRFSVRRGICVQNLSVLRLQEDAVRWLSAVSETEEDSLAESDKTSTALPLSPEHGCLVVFNVHNSMREACVVDATVRLSDTEVYRRSIRCRPSYSARLLLPVRRITVPDDQFLPSPTMALKSQFLLPPGKKGAEEVLLRRRRVRFRQELSRQVSLNWKSESDSIRGAIPIGEVLLSDATIEALAAIKVRVQLSAHGGRYSGAGDADLSDRRLTSRTSLIPGAYRCLVNSPIELRLEAVNFADAWQPLVRIWPTQQTESVCLVQSGLSQTCLPETPSGCRIEHSIRMCFLFAGVYRIAGQIQDRRSGTVYWPECPLIVQALDVPLI